MKVFYKILHFFILIICLLLQVVFFERLKLFSVNFDLVMVVIIAVALFDGTFWGILFGFVIGMVLDLMIGDIIGISALIYSINAFIVNRLIMSGFKSKFLTYSFIVFLITEINILIVSLIRYLFNFNSNWLQMGLELVTKPACNIILMFIVFPIISISSGINREIEFGFKYKNKV
jgi:rod shape-determining protein MreD